MKIPKKLHRHLEVRSEAIDEEKRVVEFSFSSEEPVERYFGMEILSHAAGACDLSRLNNAAACLFNHDLDKQIGVIEKAWVDPKDKMGRVQMRFGNSPLAQEKFQDVKDKILTKVSVGYQILEMILSKKGGENENPEYTITKWLPYECSLVTIPADDTVGLGRSISKEDEIEINVAETVIDSAGDVTNNNAAETAKERIQIMENQTVAADAAKAERERIQSITALGEKYGQKELAQKLITEGESVEKMRELTLERIGALKKVELTETSGEIGLTEKEKRNFSFTNVILAQMDPNNRTFQENAKFEREVSDAAIKATGRKDTKGFLIPFDVLRHKSIKMKRDQTVGSSTGGGNIVGTDFMDQSYIDLLRNSLAMNQCGAMELMGLHGNIAIPRKTTAATMYMVGENSAATEGALAFDQVTMAPHTGSGYIDYSRKLMLQSSPAIEQLVRQDLAQGLALLIDYQALYGSGSSNQCLGLKGTSGINTKDFAANAPTWAEIVDLETQVGTANAMIGSMKYLINAAGRGSLKTTAKASNAPLFIMADDGSVNGYPVVTSNQVASNDYWFGVWQQLMIGYWSGLDLVVDPFTGSKEGTVRVVAFQDFDIGVRQPTAFTRGNNTL
jgi:HK97 family phage major capsid protein/HK97 family phage prohead protease